MSSLTQSPAWLALQAHQSAMSQQHLRALFQNDPQRFEKFSLSFNDILIDFAKQPITRETLDLLLALAHQQELPSWITRMFSGEKINSTEHRAALHIALRSEQAVQVDGIDVMPEIKRVLKQMERFSIAVQSGARRGYTGKIFTDIVNISSNGRQEEFTNSFLLHSTGKFGFNNITDLL